MLPLAILEEAIEKNFEFQKGMYLDRRLDLSCASLFLSDHITDMYWNYAINLRAGPESVASSVSDIEVALREQERGPALYFTPWTQNRELFVQEVRRRSGTRQYQDAWMFFIEPESGVSTTHEETRSDIQIRRVSDEAGREDFVNVFIAAYGGEAGSDEPYGGLPATYFTALRQSFLARSVDTFHLVAYRNSKPLAIATLVQSPGWGGIYNVGSEPASRHLGLGSMISQRCIDIWKGSGGHTLFLQTESGSKVEQFYSRLGFRTEFLGECFSI